MYSTVKYRLNIQIYRVASSTSYDIMGFYADIQIIFGAVCVSSAVHIVGSVDVQKCWVIVSHRNSAESVELSVG